MDILKDNLPTEATIDTFVGKNKTAISIDVGLHPKDVDKLNDIIIDFLNNNAKDTLKCALEFNEDMKHLIKKIK